MAVVVIDKPDPFVLPADLKAQLRIDAADEDALLATFASAATANLDGPAGRLGRCLAPQTLELRREGFTAACGAWVGEGDERVWRYDAIQLPCPPAINIASVIYDDPFGTAQTLDPGLYTLEASDNRAALVLNPGLAWPAVRYGRTAVRIRYVAGYAEDPAADPLVAAVPDPIRVAILLMCGDLYANREGQVIDTGRGVVIVNPTVAALLAPFRIWRP